MRKSFLLILGIQFVWFGGYAQLKQSFNKGWEFVKGVDTVYSPRFINRWDDTKWEKIALPHTANLEPVEKTAQQWQGICYYRKFFTLPASSKNKHIALQFDAAMQEADVYLNGEHIFKHLGGYLPFYIDISRKVIPGKENVVVVRLDNRDNPVIPPGKTLRTLDFNYYSGIYRNAWLITKDKVYISNAIAADHIAGGGILVYYDNITARSANLVVKTELNNEDEIPRNVKVKVTLADRSGKIIAAAQSRTETIDPGSGKTFMKAIVVYNPKFWSPESPHLYQLTVEAVDGSKVVDREILKTGIKKVRITSDAFFLNDKKVKIRGTNRHQDYPWIGNALSDNAQYRDAYKIKQAGFNFVRLSHYPQSPAFMEACDELGIMVMDAIPGWQFAGNDSFKVNSLRDIRHMIRRDRNYTSVVLWEASLNESNMRKDFMQKAHDIVREELPYPGVYTAGWKNEVYDVFLPARQHGKAPDYWKKYNEARPLIVAEYGDWEYYAQNAGFNQTAYKDLKPEARTSRQLRGFGEKRLLQQSLNYQESHNDNLYGNALGDANWLMFDYNRGYAQDIESSGIMDIMRLPKFSFYFYQSQADPLNNGHFNKPMVHIANYWQEGSDTVVKIYSNCDEVELFLNGKKIARQRPDKDQYSTNLKHPPFTFHVSAFKAGTLSAKGYVKGSVVAQHQRRTPGRPSAIRLRVDHSNKDLEAGCNDIIFVYADIIDKNGTVIYDAADPVQFKLSGDGELVGQNPRAVEAGTATILLRAGGKPGKLTVVATGEGGIKGELTLYSK
jgi:beta-galactosidase